MLWRLITPHFLCYNLHKLHIEVIIILLIRKHKYIFYFVTMFLFSSIWDYFRKGNWDLLNNLFFSLWLAIVYAFVNWAWDSKKYEKK